MSVLLTLRGVTKTHGSGEHAVTVLRGIDLQVHAGELLAIVGPSGSGKSTLLNLLGCLDRPTSGSYHIEGVDVGALEDRALSRLRNHRIGFVFQSFLLVPHLTVRENIELPMLYARLGRTARRRRCDELMARVGLSHRTGHRPNQLSGGECQRVAIARALANDPALLLADEPTGNLDSKISAEILSVFADLHAAGHTVLMITHDQDIARRVPRRVLILDGEIRADGAPEAQS